MENHEPVPVLCDRCLASGTSAHPDFSRLGDLLAFEPVPRRTERVDGWDADAQRWFIAALAATGSARRAAAAVGRAPYGAEQLRKAEGGEGFACAWDEALAIAAKKEAHQRTARYEAATRYDKAAGLAPSPWGAAAARRSAAQPPVPAPDQAERDHAAEGAAFMEYMLKTYMAKLDAERECRLSGRIAEADFYIRQVTWLEVALDLGSGDGFLALADFRHRGYSLVDIAATPFSDLLDAARRDHWTKCGDPPRPPHPLRHLLTDHGRFSSEPLEATWGGLEQSHEEQLAAFEEQYRRDAAAHIKWEAEARRDFANRSEAPREQSRETGSAGQPAASPTGLTSRDLLP